MSHATEQLAALIDRKHGMLVQLREVGRRQMDLVASRDTASLIKLLAAKQSLITALQAVERRADALFGRRPERRVWAIRRRAQPLRPASGRVQHDAARDRESGKTRRRSNDDPPQ